MEQTRSEVKVIGVYAREDAGTLANHFVLMRDGRKRRLPMYVGQFEAFAISVGLEGGPPDRPFTHDAMLKLVTLMGGVLEEAYINDVRDATFYAVIRVRVGEEVKELDVRPSDALALALRAKCPIYVADHVLEAAER